jgi:hypothetical protein
MPAKSAVDVNVDPATTPQKMLGESCRIKHHPW